VYLPKARGHIVRRYARYLVYPPQTNRCLIPRINLRRGRGKFCYRLSGTGEEQTTSVGCTSDEFRHGIATNVSFYSNSNKKVDGALVLYVEVQTAMLMCTA